MGTASCWPRSSVPGSWASGWPAATSAIALLANTLATGAALLALILTFGPISGAHFNPVVTLSEAWQGRLWRGDVLPYIAAQVIGAIAGVAAANAMFGEPSFAGLEHARAGGPQLLSEAVATFGLLAVIVGCDRHRPGPSVRRRATSPRPTGSRRRLLREPCRHPRALPD